MGDRRAPVVQVLDRHELEVDLVSEFSLVVWSDLGRRGAGLEDREVAVLEAVSRLDIGLYFIGEDLADNSRLNEVGRAAWEELAGLVLAGSSVVGPGTVEPGEVRADCENFVVTLVPEDTWQTAEPCRPTLLSTTIVNNGACEAGGVVVTNLVAEGLEVVGAAIRYEPECPTTGRIERRSRQVTYRLGRVDSKSSPIQKTWVVLAVDTAECECPRLEVRRGLGDAGLVLRGTCRLETWLQKSINLQQWNTIRTNAPSPDLTELMRVPLSVGQRGFYRLAVPP